MPPKNSNFSQSIVASIIIKLLSKRLDMITDSTVVRGTNQQREKKAKKITEIYTRPVTARL